MKQTWWHLHFRERIIQTRKLAPQKCLEKFKINIDATSRKESKITGEMSVRAIGRSKVRMERLKNYCETVLSFLI